MNGNPELVTPHPSLAGRMRLVRIRLTLTKVVGVAAFVVFAIGLGQLIGSRLAPATPQPPGDAPGFWLMLLGVALGFLTIMGILTDRRVKKQLYALPPYSNDESDLPTLTRLLSHHEPLFRRGAALRLAELADPAALPALRQQLYVWHRGVTPAVVEAIGAIDTPAAREALVHYLKQPERPRQAEAFAAARRALEDGAARTSARATVPDDDDSTKIEALVDASEMTEMAADGTYSTRSADGHTSDLQGPNVVDIEIPCPVCGETRGTASMSSLAILLALMGWPIMLAGWYFAFTQGFAAAQSWGIMLMAGGTAVVASTRWKRVRCARCGHTRDLQTK